MTNTGALFDVITLTVSGNSWPTYLFIRSGSAIIPYTVLPVGLNPGEGRDVGAEVKIPNDALGHDVAQITARAGLNPGVFATSILTTTVYFQFDLPVIRK